MPPRIPVATDGAAPITTTKSIEASDSLNKRIASGNHAIDGIVCRPVMRDPVATRINRQRETTTPMTAPITTAAA